MDAFAAELSKAKSKLKEDKRRGVESKASTAVSRQNKKISKENGINKGVIERGAKDTIEKLKTSLTQQNTAALARKAKLYDAYKRGQKRDEDGEILVDFDQMSWHSSEEFEDEEEEDLIEWTDEFGRTKMVRRNLVEAGEAEGPSRVIRGDYMQPAPELNEDKIREIIEEDDSVKPEYFDASKEKRSKGVGFFQFSLDEEERKKQFEEMDKRRKETERQRMNVLSALERRNIRMNDRREMLLRERDEEAQKRSALHKEDEMKSGLEGKEGKKSMDESMFKELGL